MKPHDNKGQPHPASGHEGNTGTPPGQANAGYDRAEVDSAQAQQAHQRGSGGAPGTGTEHLPRSEEAKNQEATSQQSRSLSGTTAPSKV